jgi:hypothetical protein
MNRTVHLFGLLAVLATALEPSGTADAAPAKAPGGASSTAGSSLET